MSVRHRLVTSVGKHTLSLVKSVCTHTLSLVKSVCPHTGNMSNHMQIIVLGTREISAGDLSCGLSEICVEWAQWQDTTRGSSYKCICVLRYKERKSLNHVHSDSGIRNLRIRLWLTITARDIDNDRWSVTSGDSDIWSVNSGDNDRWSVNSVDNDIIMLNN